VLVAGDHEPGEPVDLFGDGHVLPVRILRTLEALDQMLEILAEDLPSPSRSAASSSNDAMEARRVLGQRPGHVEVLGELRDGLAGRHDVLDARSLRFSSADE
jgi:hypothetical protein